MSRYNVLCLSLLWNAKSSLGSTTTVHLLWPAKLQPTISPFLSNQCFLTHEAITEMSLSENGCQVSLNSENSLCVLVLIPACNRTGDMTACVLGCIHAKSGCSGGDSRGCQRKRSGPVAKNQINLWRNATGRHTAVTNHVRRRTDRKTPMGLFHIISFDVCVRLAIYAEK